MRSVTTGVITITTGNHTGNCTGVADRNAITPRNSAFRRTRAPASVARRYTFLLRAAGDRRARGLSRREDTISTRPPAESGPPGRTPARKSSSDCRLTTALHANTRCLHDRLDRAHDHCFSPPDTQPQSTASRPHIASLSGAGANLTRDSGVRLFSGKASHPYP